MASSCKFIGVIFEEEYRVCQMPAWSTLTTKRSSRRGVFFSGNARCLKKFPK